MAATIKIKNSSTTGAVPTSGDLVQGELAVNVTDTGLYTENASGTVVKLNAPSIDDKNTGATKHLTISTGGNLGLGVTPSAWWSSMKALQVGSGAALYDFGSSNVALGSNLYFDGTNSRYINTDYASYYQQNNGSHIWATAASGTAGNAITFTQAMTLDASGNLGVGGTSPATKLDVYGTKTLASDLGVTNIRDTASLASGNGGAIVLMGKYNSGGSYVGGAFVNASKENATDGNYSYALTFGTNVNGGALTERARIDSSGNLLVGTTFLSNTERLNVTFPGSSKVGLSVDDTSATSCSVMIIRNNGTICGSISKTTTATAYNTSSDYRLKHDIAPMTGALNKVTALKPVTYKWNADNSDGQGFIAHELAEVCPDAVHGVKDAVETYIDAEGNEQTRPVYQGIDTSFLVATLTAAIQELNAKFEAYKAAHP